MSSSNNNTSSNDNNGRLKGKVAVVTGASSGMGAASAIRFAKEGANVVLVGRRTDALNHVAKQIQQLNNGTKTLVITGDVGSEDVNREIVEKTISTFGKLHIAFNNAGIYTGGKPIWETDTKVYQQTIKTNVDSIFYALKYQIPAISASGGGSIINNSSVLGVRPLGHAFGQAGVSSYVTSKYAVNGLTQSAAVEAAEKNVRVNAIAPGIVATPIFGSDESVVLKTANTITSNANLLKQAATSEDITGLVTFLASDESRYITGSIYLIDGGANLRG